MENMNIAGYPDKTHYFSPEVCYPEYPYGEETISVNNKIYDIIRQCLYMAGYDHEHYGQKKWNPLKVLIKEGDTVLIKPNWVHHKNKCQQETNNLDCLVTNPSIIRAIVDYVVIALKGSGRIIIGDAPMQGCNLQNMFRSTGYDQLFAFYKKEGIKVEVMDLRKYSTEEQNSGILSKPKTTKNSEGCIHVDLKEKSMHAENDQKKPAYKVSDYKIEETIAYHHEGCHTYEINKIALEADVIINVPKPKTHRLNGMTAAQKNFVGITYEKACLPHRIEGAKENGGDAYQRKSVWKEWMHLFDEKQTRYSVAGLYSKARITDMLMKACYVMGCITSRDKYRIGSWYGNDTIWRTAVDLNNIVLHADKKGVLTNSVQRKVFTIADLIVAGQGEGPVGPSPKPLGMIMISDNNLLFDRVMCEIMGFSYNKFPVFSSDKAYKVYGYQNLCDIEREKVTYSNTFSENTYCLKDFVGTDKWKFEPHSCWKGYIEKVV